jgi:chromosome segregation ATPase
MAEMNELLEEAEGQCSALSDELDTAVAAIDAVESRAGSLYEHASKSAAQVKARLAALVERTGAAEQALESSRQDAVSDLDALADQATGVRGAVSGLLEHVREQLQALQLQQARLDEGMNGRMQGVETDVNALAEKVQAARDAVAQELEQAGQAIERLARAVQAAHQALAERQSELDSALGALEATAEKKAGEWVGGLQKALTVEATAVVDLANRAITSHNDAMKALTIGFAVDVKGHLAGSIDPLKANLDRLKRAVEPQGALLSAKAQEALARVRDVVPVLGEIKAAFEQSRRLA